MDTLQSLNLIDSTSNKLYMLKVSPEIAERAQKDIVFATRLLQEMINSGQTVFDKIEKVSGTTESTNLNEPMRISSLSPSSSDQAKDEQTANEKNESNIDEPPPKRQKTLKDFCETLIKNRKTRDEAREKEHQERLAAINKLTDVVAQLVAHRTPET